MDIFLGSSLLLIGVGFSIVNGLISKEGIVYFISIACVLVGTCAGVVLQEWGIPQAFSRSLLGKLEGVGVLTFNKETLNNLTIYEYDNLDFRTKVWVDALKDAEKE